MENVLDKLINDNSIIYHYTTLESAFAIIESQNLWFNNLKQMSDISELEYSKKEIIDILLKMINGCKEDKEKNIMIQSLWCFILFHDNYIIINKLSNNNEDLINYGEVHYKINKNVTIQFLNIINDAGQTFKKCWDISQIDFYGFCFSYDCKNLSLWREYSGKNTGICIGFDPALFERLNDDFDYHFYISNVIYGSNNLEKIITEIKSNVDNFDLDLVRLSALLKREEFSTEHEIRAFWQLKDNGFPIKYRVANKKMKAYVELIEDYEKELFLSSIKEIIIANGSKIDADDRFFNNYLKSKNINCKVIKSDISYISD